LSAQLQPIAPAKTDVEARVFYNGEEKTISFQVGITVETADKQAVDIFKIGTNPHTFGLYREDGVTELLPLEAPIARVHGHEPLPAGHVGIRQGETLLLRPSTVRGG
jgi:hypothetical protein